MQKMSSLKFSMPLRLGIAFLLGLLLGPFPLLPTWLQLTFPLLVLLTAMLLSLLLDSDAGIGGSRSTLLAMLLVIGASGLIVLLLFLPPPLSFLALALIPCTVGAAIAFTVGSMSTRRFAIICACTAWLGMGLHLLLAVLSGLSSGNSLNGLLLVLTIIGVIVGFALAAFGGLLGRIIRSRLTSL